MFTKRYAAAYGLLFLLTLMSGMAPLLLSGRADATVFAVVLVTAFVVPFVLIWGARRMGYPVGEAVICARCGAEQPMFRKPADAAQALRGGYDCRGCGAKLDARGREIATGAGG
ncbi:MAG: hypothetical protein IPK81_11640 [Rhodospirillales bacterium]|nr:MAG: hypothetical protein IPK81_11640 [Rhodospirillales bacterium]